MPSCSTAYNPKKIKITFTEDDHKYTSVIDGKTITYTSGTTFVHHFTPKFDPTGEIIARCAKKNGLTVEEMQRKWDEKKNHSCVFGTKIHEICENIMKDRDYKLLVDDEYSHKVSMVAERAAKTLKDKIDVIEAEKIVFDPYLPTPIAGTIDLLGKSKTDGSILILDWKSNDKIETTNTFKNFCLDPISDIPSINYYHYALQLSLYQYILVSGGYYPKDTKFKRAIIHLKDDRSHVYTMPDLTSHIQSMLLAY